MVDIFDEVDEDLRAERAQQFLRRYGGVLIAAAAVVVLAVAGWQAWRWWDARRDAAAAATYLTGMSIADRGGPNDAAARAAAVPVFEKLLTGPAGYATLGRLRIAGLLADSGNLAGASAMWDQVSADSAADPLLRDLANLLWAEHQIDAGDPSLVEARLKALDVPDVPWRALAREALGLLDMRVGRIDAARDLFRELSQDPKAADGVRGRAAGLLNRLGG